MQCNVFKPDGSEEPSYRCDLRVRRSYAYQPDGALAIWALRAATPSYDL